MNQHIKKHQMENKCQYISNICQAQTKGEWDNKTDKRNKREQEKGPRSASRSKGSKALSLRVRRFEDFECHMTSWDIAECRETDEVSQTRRFEGFRISSVVL